MARTHYHVMNGQPGCIPDNNEVFDAYEDAKDYAQREMEGQDFDSDYWGRGWGENYVDDVNEQARWTSKERVYYYEVTSCMDVVCGVGEEVEA